MPSTKRYQTGLVVLFFLTWGSVFLARMSVLYLAPFIVPDLHLSHEQVGLLASALALAWAASGLIFGAISDRIGRRPVLIPTVFLFSLLSWLSGLARSFGELLFVRTLMGIAEGPTFPTMTSMIEASSEPKNRGRNIGIVVSAGALVGLALAPVLTTQIAARFGWRAAFFVTGIPGMILGFLIWRFVKEPGEAEIDHVAPRQTIAQGIFVASPVPQYVALLSGRRGLHDLAVRHACLRAVIYHRSFPAVCYSGGFHHWRRRVGRVPVGLDFSLDFRPRRQKAHTDFCCAYFRNSAVDVPGAISYRASMAYGGCGVS